MRASLDSTANQPLKYARVPLTHEFQDAPEMRQLMQSYQDQLEAVGLEGLGLKPIPHLSAINMLVRKPVANATRRPMTSGNIPLMPKQPIILWSLRKNVGTSRGTSTPSASVVT